MALILPKIVYPSGGSNTLNFFYPPRKVPFRSYKSVRHDNTASSGAREIIIERLETYLNFEMEYVVIGSDVTGWDNFMQNALQGMPFDYYPDHTSGSFVTYYLQNTNWDAAYKQLGMYTFSCSFYQKVGWP